MCNNIKCERKEECYRFRAIPCRIQAYANFDEKDCEYFYPIAKGKKLYTDLKRDLALHEEGNAKDSHKEV